jgi:hypothetical protein
LNRVLRQNTFADTYSFSSDITRCISSHQTTKMEAKTMDPRIVTAIAVVFSMFVAFAVTFIVRRRRIRQIQQRLRPEHDRSALQQHGDSRTAEAVLEDREKQVETFFLRALSPIDREAYAMEWADVQRHFIDDPSAAVGTADRLVGCVMIDRGYPMTHFEQRAEDISVTHPAVVQNYRAGHGIVMRHADGQATTEELRQAMIHYRTLFDELLQPAAEPLNVHPIHRNRGGAARERAS